MSKKQRNEELGPDVADIEDVDYRLSEPPDRLAAVEAELLALRERVDELEDIVGAMSPHVAEAAAETVGSAPSPSDGVGNPHPGYYMDERRALQRIR